MVISYKKDTVVKSILYLALAIYIFFALLNASFYAQRIPAPVFKAVSYGSLLMLILAEILDWKWDRQSIVALPVISVLLAISVLDVGIFSNVSIILLFAFFYRKVPLTTVVKIGIWVSAIALVLIVVSALRGTIINYVESSGDRIRHYLGFRYSLFPSAVLLNLIMGRFYLKQTQVKILEWLAWAVANEWFYRQTDSRLTYYSVVILLLIWLFLKYIPFSFYKFRKFFALFIPVFPASFLVSLWFAFNYTSTNTVHLWLNKILGNRLYLMHKSMELYGFKARGQYIDWVGNGLNLLGRRMNMRYLYVDNLYMQILQRYGWVIAISFVLAMTAVMVILYQKKQLFLYIIMINLALHGLIDDLIGNVYYNTFLLIIGMLLIHNYQLDSANTQQVEDETGHYSKIK